ncbi:MAG: hypothetical protein FWD59_10865, partial [Micrococcales bacterium]|nr:hypothetical protein [Micrococcales bacterium]
MVAALDDYPSRLTNRSLTFVEPEEKPFWGPRGLWEALQDPSSNGMTLLTGRGGVGKTRTLLEVARLAASDGWQVLHVRGGNASPVAGYLSERLAADQESQILLVVDQLNLARQLDLLALDGLTSECRTPRPRLRVLASARTEWERKHRGELGIDRFNRLALVRTEHDTANLCRAIVREIAPRAVEGAGIEEVLGVTGVTLPILAVLLGQVVEHQFVATGTLPHALVSEDLGQWIEGQLREDHPPAQASDEPVAVAARILGAAVSLAGSPAQREDVISATASATGSVGDSDMASHIVDKLVQIGWLRESESGLVAAHDVVADTVLAGAVFRETDNTVRQNVVRTLLDVAFVSSAAFANIVDSLGRVLDERELRSDPGASLVSAAQAWLDERHADLTTRLPTGACDRSRVVTQLIRSELFNLEKGSYWRDLAWPLIETLEDDDEEPLLAACLLMSRDAEPRIVDRAIDWCARHASVADDRLLRAVLERRDLGPRQAGEAINSALSWLDALTSSREAGFILLGLFRRSELGGPALKAVTRHLFNWIDEFERAWNTPQLVRVARARADLHEEACVRLDEVARRLLR